jgi:hypothetical protein
MMGGRAPSSPELDFFLEPARLPNNWLGYTALLAVVVPASEWSQLKPAQQDALLNWTAAGGDFFLVDGAIETILPTSQRLIGLPDQPGVLPYFFGHIHLLTSAIISQQGWENAIPNAVVSTSIANFALPANRARDWSWIADRGFRLPIPGVGQIPTRAYLLILVLFLFLIGPVNYVYLWRKKRQVLIVLTVPLLSLTFMMLLSGYALLSQGLDVRARAATFTVLDQASKRAATRSSVSLYPGGLMPSGGVQFTGDTAVFPLGTDGLGQRSRMSLDLTNNQSFRSGLLRSRAPANFDQIRVQAARERLSFENSGNEMRVVNGLGARVLQLLYRDGERWWTLDAPLAMGDQTKLTVRTNSKPLNFAELIKDTLVDSGKFQEVASIQPDQTYLALLDSSPFWEAGVIEPTEHESFHLVLGYPEKQQ